MAKIESVRCISKAARRSCRLLSSVYFWGRDHNSQCCDYADFVLLRAGSPRESSHCERACRRHITGRNNANPCTFFTLISPSTHFPAHHLSILLLFLSQFDIIFPKMPCSWISVDAMDVSGESHLDVDDAVFKQRIDAQGRVLVQHDPRKHEVGPAAKLPAKSDDPNAAATEEKPACGSCYGSEDAHRKCCNTCSEVREQYRAKGWALDAESVEQCKGEGYNEEIKAEQGEGCRVYGDMNINKVAGNIHFAPGRSYQQGAMHVHDLAPFVGQEMFDFSHTVKKMAFGREYPVCSSSISKKKKKKMPRKNLQFSPIFFFAGSKESFGWRHRLPTQQKLPC